MADRNPPSDLYDVVKGITDFLLAKTEYCPLIGIICGSGLGGLADALEDQQSFSYGDIPNFPTSTVAGHSGMLVFGKLRGKTVVCMKGRFHFYEGYPMWKVAMPVRVLSMLGVKTMFVTNAAGSINQNYNVGDLMVIKDHIGFPLMAGNNPLIGSNDERFGPRFPAATSCYDKELQKLAFACAKEIGVDGYIKHGVYVMLSGPCYETPAELRFLSLAGADAVGMSTVPEVATAAHCGMKVLGISMITNKGILTYDDVPPPNHAEVLEAGKARAKDIQNLVAAVIEKMSI